MKKALETLKRVRETQKRGARLAFGAKERERQMQEAKVDNIQDSMDRSRSGVLSEGVEACWVAQAHAYSLRLEVELRRETTHLIQRSMEAEILQGELRKASQATKVVENVMERLEEQEALEAKRAEIRRMDDLAARRWRKRGD